MSRRDLVASAAGFPIGIVAGITGVGGGEYRAPVLLLLLRNVRWTIAGNLLAGALVAVSTILLRNALFQPFDIMLLAATMVAASVPGAYLGAIAAQRIPSKWLKIALAGILTATALRLILVESVAGGTFSFGWKEASLGALTGAGIGVISGLLGVAGGEYRIPALILIFGLPAITAGTISSLVSLPQQVVGFWKHRGLGQAGPGAIRLGVIMGVVGALGVAVGVALLHRTNDATVTAFLATIMLVSAARIAWEARTPDRGASSPA
ncbi:MAG: sulfite exporter TauE/SafE family protein [Thermoplasmata archaeon]|nr:sulfite exporter TauE/SafE family protein [Thermoplasmata archaeon]